MGILEKLGTIASYLLPLFVIVLLIFLVIMIVKVLKVVDNINQTITKLDTTISDTNKTLERVNGYVDQLQPAFDTIETTAKQINNINSSVSLFKGKVVKALANKFGKKAKEKTMLVETKQDSNEN